MQSNNFVRFPVVLIMALVMFTPESWSQDRKKITFVILDETTLNPITGAEVQASGASDTAAISDSNGLVVMELSVGEVFVSSNDYNSRYVNFDPDSVKGVFPIYLEPAFNMLEQAVISAGRYNQPLKETSTSIEIIRPELLKERNSLTIKDVLGQTAGVTVTDNQVNIRNGSGWSYGAGSRVMIMLDDMPMLSGDAAAPLWTFIPTEGIAAMEVIKGAGSVLYGSSALTGVVNITSEKPGIRPKTSVNGFYGMYNKPKEIGWQWSDKQLTIRGFNAYHLRRINKLALSVQVNGQMDDGYRMGDHDNRLRVGTHLSRSLLNDRSVIGIRSNTMHGHSASFLLWQNYDSAYTALNRQTTSTEVKRQTVDFYWKYYGKNNLRILIQSRQLIVDNDVNNGNPVNDQSNSSYTGYYEIRFSQKSTRLALHYGYLYQQTLSNSPLFSGRHTTVNQAPYIQAEWKPFSRLTIDFGGRYEWYKMDDFKAAKSVFRSGLNYRTWKYTFIRASFGQGFRFPSIAESFIQTTVGSISIYPNEELKPESGWNAEVGVKQGFNIGKLKLILDVSAYWMEYRNMMEFIFTQWSTNATIENGLGFGFKSLNVGDSRITGTDITLLAERAFRNGHEVKGMVGYTWSQPVSLEPDKVFARNAFGKELSFNNTSSDPGNNLLKYRYRHLLKMEIRYTYKFIELAANVRYNSFMTNIDRAFVEFPIDLMVRGIDEAREADKNGRTFVDIRMGIILEKKYRIGMVASNIFQSYQMSRPADITGPGSFLIQVGAMF